MLVASPLPAQSPTTGAIEGGVLDETGAALAGATLEARSRGLQGARTTVTGARVRFHLSELPPGVYTVSATLAGFVTVKEQGVRVALSEIVTVPFALKMSRSTEIEVNGEAPLLDTTSAAGGQNVREDVI